MDDIDIFRAIQDRFKGLDTPDFIGFGIDGINLALESKIDKIFDDPVPDRKFLGGRTDHGHLLRPKQGI